MVRHCATHPLAESNTDPVSPIEENHGQQDCCLPDAPTRRVIPTIGADRQGHLASALSGGEART
jgi:hypothetical protein